MRASWMSFGLAAVIACGAAETPEIAEEPPPEAPVDPPTVDPDVREPASPVSPSEMVASAGMAREVADAIGTPAYDMEESDPDLVALRTGVLAAEVIVGHRALTNAQLVAHIDAIRAGLEQVGAGQEADDRAQELREKVKSGALSPDELQHQLDELAMIFPSELEAQGKGWTRPYFEAGTWLRTVNLLSMVVAEHPSEAGRRALTQPDVIAYFRQELITEGEGKASEQVTRTVDQTLERLGVLAAKAEPLTEAEIREVTSLTGGLLELVREPAR